MTQHNGGLSPINTAANVALIREIVAHKRALGKARSKAEGLPTIEQIAFRFNVTAAVIYRMCSGRRPYRRQHPRDRAARSSP